jgi:hypothetical protein
MPNISRSGEHQAPAADDPRATIRLRPRPLSGFDLCVPVGAVTVCVRVERYRRGEVDAEKRAGLFVCEAGDDAYLVDVAGSRT